MTTLISILQQLIWNLRLRRYWWKKRHESFHEQLDRQFKRYG